eukprot:m.964233 g.964233  ORF g.964233 m.964233 type:complete len:281 (+) comp23902_c0_seq11:303-1145(+)
MVFQRVLLFVLNVCYGLKLGMLWRRYLLGSFSRGMTYDGDGLARAEWPASGYFEVTPMLYMTVHWTAFTAPGWRAVVCATGQCPLAGGGDSVTLLSPSGTDFTVVLHTFTHAASKCIRNDPRQDWTVDPVQDVVIHVPAGVSHGATLNVWTSCSNWSYPQPSGSGYLRRQTVVIPAAGNATVTVYRNCYVTVTTLNTTPSLAPTPFGSRPPNATSAETSGSQKSHTAAMKDTIAVPLPLVMDFNTVSPNGGEAPYFQDQMGKFELVCVDRSNLYLYCGTT